jgi:predicted PurR-regulated permease PerM
LNKGTFITERLQSIAPLLVLALLGIGAYMILHSFLIPVAWAAILTYATWPLYCKLRRILKRVDVIAAFLMTIFIVVVVVFPFALLILSISDEIRMLYSNIKGFITQPPDVPNWIKDIPWLREPIMRGIDEIKKNPQFWHRLLPKDPSQWVNWILGIAGGVGRNLAKMGISLITVFFFFLYGDILVKQLRQVLDRFTGKSGGRWMESIANTVRVVIYGILLTAMAQGIMAGIGYWMFGLRTPVILAACTGLMALFPFGPPFVWVPISITFFFQEPLWKAIAFFLWGFFGISGIDNVVKPLFISTTTKIPFLLVFFGVIGGLGSFGLIGVFVGPILLSILLALWKEWIGPTDGKPQEGVNN